VEPEIVRNSVGIEHADEITAVLGQALKAAHKYAFSEQIVLVEPFRNQSEGLAVY
jgi:hypothetical protein